VRRLMHRLEHAEADALIPGADLGVESAVRARADRWAARRRASDTRGRGSEVSGGWLARHVELNSVRGSRSAKFAVQDGANARVRQKFSAPRRFPAPAGGARGLSRAANRRLIFRAGVLAGLLEML
jgi:hypothetical protein